MNWHGFIEKASVEQVGERQADQTMLLRGARVVDPSQGLDGPGAVLVHGGRVAAIGPGETVAAEAERLQSGISAHTLDLAAGWVLAPGFVDLHAHLREPGGEGKETIQTATAAAARGGFTTVCCMPNTQPILDSRAVLEQVRTAARGCPARVLPIAAITRGEAGAELVEMAELAEAGAVAFSD